MTTINPVLHNTTQIKDLSESIFKKKEDSFLPKFAALSIVAATVALTTIAYLNSKDLTGETAKETLDKTAIHYIGKPVFASQEEVREYTLNNLLKNHPLESNKVVKALGGYESIEGGEERVKIITQLREEGLFKDEALFNSVMKTLSESINKNKLSALTSSTDDVRHKGVSEQIKTLRLDTESSIYRATLKY
jgi:hypothetical protein